MSRHEGQPLTAALVAAIDAAIAAPVYLTRPPDAAAAPYLVVHPLSVTLDGSLADSNDADAVYQVTCVGVGPEQAEGIADVVRLALVMSSLTITGRSIATILHYESVPVSVDEGAHVPLFLARDQYRIHSYAA